MDGRHLSAEELEQYRNRRLAPAEILRVHEHAGACAECAARLADSARALSAEPDEGELIAFVAGTLDSQRAAAIAQHLESCASCRKSVEEFRDIRGELARTDTPEPRSKPATARWWLTAAAAIVIVAGGVGLILMETRTRELATIRDANGVDNLQGSISVSGLTLSEDERSLIAGVVRDGHLPAGPRIGIGKPGQLRSASAPDLGFHVLSPIGKRLLTDRPEFHWLPLSKTATYEVIVFTPNQDIVAQSGMLTATQWQPAEPLPRATDLAWQVAAYRGKPGAVDGMVIAPSKTEPLAEFRIIDGATAARIDEAHKAGSHLLAAALLAKVGLNEEAASEIDALAALNPNSEFVRGLGRKP